MTATLTQIHDASQPVGDFAKRVQGAIIKASWAIVYEGTEVADHAARLALAKTVLQTPRTYMERYYRLFISTADIQAKFSSLATVTDTEIEDAVNGFWTIIAGLEA